MVDNNSNTITNRTVCQHTRRTNNTQPQDNSRICTNYHSPVSSTSSPNNQNKDFRSKPFCQNVTLLMTNIKIYVAIQLGFFIIDPSTQIVT